MSTPLVSIVIPVYNVENYLRECLDSIVNQTLKDIEIIIVNDCSPANEDAIIQEYMKKDSRIIYIKNEKNIGLGASRNVGFSKAKGKYLGCVDSDDYVALDMFEKMYNKAETTDADFTWCRYQEYNNKSKEVINDFNSLFDEKYNNKIVNFEKLGSDFWHYKIDVSACCKLYKKEFFKEYIVYPEGVLYEDVVPHFTAWLNAEKVYYINEPLYFYRIFRDGSVMTSAKSKPSNKNTDDTIIFLNGIVNLFKSKGLYETYKRRLLLYVYSVYTFREDRIEYLYNEFKKFYLSLNLTEKELKELKVRKLNLMLKYDYKTKNRLRTLVKPFAFIGPARRFIKNTY